MTVAPAEHRVLQLLPTHPTLGKIGAQLHISGTPSKAHAIAVYRKLNVYTRTETAVRKERSLGLLPP